MVLLEIKTSSDGLRKEINGIKSLPERAGRRLIDTCAVDYNVDAREDLK